jgi:F-type H+-transporting ATPase subunit epsilon
MRLQVMLPTEILLNREVNKIVAEAENGSFCIKPRHIDFVAALVPGILSFESKGKEEFLAINEGVLIKRGSDVLVSTRSAVKDADLGKLQETVAKQFHILDKKQKSARSAVARLEANFVRRFIEIGEHGHE